MAQYVQLKVENGLPVCFCEPRSPWQRRTNENTNRLLRQYLPRGTDLSTHSAEDLAVVAAALNGRPGQPSAGVLPPKRSMNQSFDDVPSPERLIEYIKGEVGFQ